MARVLDDPSRQPHPGEPRRPQGRRSSGVLRLDRDPDDGAVPRCAAPRRPRRGQAARQPGLPRHPVSARSADAGQARALSGARRRAGLPVAHQGRRWRRLLDRLGRARRRHDPVRLAHAGSAARTPAAAGGPAQGAHGRAGRRRRARRGQRVRGAARGLEARHPQRLVGDRLQPPEPRSGGTGAPVRQDRGLLRRRRLAGGHAQVRQAAAGGVRPARRCGAAPVDRRLSERPLLGADVQGRRRAGASAWSTISATCPGSAACSPSTTTTRSRSS